MCHVHARSQSEPVSGARQPASVCFHFFCLFMHPSSLSSSLSLRRLHARWRSCHRDVFFFFYSLNNFFLFRFSIVCARTVCAHFSLYFYTLVMSRISMYSSIFLLWGPLFAFGNRHTVRSVHSVYLLFVFTCNGSESLDLWTKCCCCFCRRITTLNVCCESECMRAAPHYYYLRIFNSEREMGCKCAKFQMKKSKIAATQKGSNNSNSNIKKSNWKPE